MLCRQFSHIRSLNALGERVKCALKSAKDKRRADALLSKQPTPVVAASVTLGEPSDTPLITEEADNSPLQSVQQSVSVQCSPNMTDAATQTDSDTSDAAVQWPADVHQVVTMDHAYTDKRELDNQEEEDTRSLDLFPSDDEFSEDSQPWHKQSDPEYNVSSSEPSQSTQESHASTDTHKEDRVFLVFEEQLKQLLQHCLKCGSLIAQEDVKELQNE